MEAGVQNVSLHQLYKFSLALDAPLEEFLPRLDEVTVYQDSTRSTDRMFLEFAKRQLMGIGASDDNENS